jgi:hypothetical protein
MLFGGASKKSDLEQWPSFQIEGTRGLLPQMFSQKHFIPGRSINLLKVKPHVLIYALDRLALYCGEDSR